MKVRSVVPSGRTNVTRLQIVSSKQIGHHLDRNLSLSPLSMPISAPAHENPSGVSSIELFFDLVFVFVITQVTQLVEHAHGAMDFLRALLVLVPIWWMYAGYAWLTNNVRVTWQMRLVLIAAMAGFLVM